MDKFVYYDNSNYEYKEIDEEYLSSPDKLKDYFGYLEDTLDANGELKIFKLQPYKTLKKDITYKFVNND